ncbi:PAS domain S-box protein [Methanospirillum lacunae]|nr:PAS domain S-box protein [Methanospirillum lacunae]
MKTLDEYIPKNFRLPLFIYLIILCLIIGTGYFAVNYQQNINEKEIKSQLSAIADLKSSQISVWYHERDLDAEILAKDLVIPVYINSRNNPGSSDYIQVSLLEWMNTTLEKYDYQGIILLSPTGEVLLKEPQNALISQDSIHQYLSPALNSSDPINTDLFRDPDTHNPVMEYWCPIKEKTDGPVIGVLVYQIDPKRYLFPLIQSWPTNSETSESLLIRPEDNYVLFINDLRHVSNASLSLRIPLSKDDVPAVMAVKGQVGIVYGNDYRGVPVIADILRINGTPWYLVAKIDQNEIYAPFRFFVSLVMAILLLLLAVSGIAIWAVWVKRENDFISQNFELKQKELILADRVRLLMQQANDAIFIFDSNWKIIEANDRASEQYGYSLDEFRQMSLADLRSDKGKATLSEDLERMNNPLGSIVHTEHRRKDKSVFPTESSIRTINIDGATYHQAIIRDYTERIIFETELEKRNSDLYSLNEELGASFEELSSQEEELRHQMDTLKQSEIQMQELQNRLIEAQKVGHLGSWEYYINTGQVWLSDEGFRLFGLDVNPEGLIELEKVLSCVPDKDHVYRALMDLIEHEVPFKLEFTIQPIGSQTRILSSIAELIQGEEKNPIKVIGIFQDVTERKHIESQLRKQEEKLSAFFHSPILGTLMGDIYGNIFQANDEFLRIIGYSRYELEKGLIRWDDITPPEFLQLDQSSIIEAQEKGSCTPYEKQYFRKDGARIWVLIGYVLTGEGKDESVAFILDISRVKEKEDLIQKLNQSLEEKILERTNQLESMNIELKEEVEERILAEEEIQKALSLLTAALESTADGLLVVDKSRKIVTYNKIFLSMWNIPDSIIKTDDDITTLGSVLHLVKNPDQFLEKINQVYKDPSRETCDVLELLDGKLFERVSKPQKVGEEIVGTVWSFRDITQKTQMENEIERSLREKEILLKEIHHRVKNNMQVISSLFYIQSNITKDEKLKEILKEGQNRVKSIALVHEELYQSQDLNSINYSDYLRKISKNMFDSYQVNSSRIKLELSHEDVLITISKAVPCGLIINELLSNSLKHAFPDQRKGTITISFSSTDNEYLLVYSDNGTGISEEDFLSHPTTLGVELIKGLTKQLQGTIELDQREGTTYRIRFPV